MGASCSITNDPVITYPVELVVNILLNLTASDLVSCRRVNHHLKGIIECSQELQHHIDTAVAGVVDNPNSPLSLHERRDTLARRQQAWDTLQPQHTTSDIVIKYLFAAGIEAERRSDGTWLHLNPLREEGHYGSLKLAACPDDNDLVAVGMLCRDPASLRQRCSSYSFEVDILYFSGDGGEHSWTRRTTVHVKDVLEKYGVTWDMNIVGIHTNLLAVHFRPTTIRGGDQWPEHELWVFDWKTGEEIACLKGKGIEAFRFLSNSVMVLANKTPSESTATLELFSISVTNSNLSPTSMMKVATLRLPFVDNGCRIARMRFHPPFVRNPVIHKDRLLYNTSIDAKPFTSAQSDNIIFVIINIGSRRGYDNLSFFVHPSTLLRHIPGPLSRSQGNMWDPIPWEVWGPTATRWTESGIRVEEGHACGHRYLLKQPYPGGWEILDFNRYRVGRLGKGFAVENETARLTVETEPSCARSYGIEKGIRSSLPFVKLVPKKWPDYTHAVLYEDRVVIGKKVSNGQCLVEKLYFG